MNNRHPHPSATSPEEIEAIETSLRLCAPAPRPELRERVLARCQDLTRSAGPTRTTRPRFGAWSGAGWRLAGAGVLCLLQWIVVSHFDARSEAAIHGGPPAPLWARATPRRDLAQAGRDWPQALQRRALLLSALMNNGEAALPATPPPAHPS